MPASDAQQFPCTRHARILLTLFTFCLYFSMPANAQHPIEFADVVTYPVVGVGDVIIDDFDGDGKLDIAVAADGVVTILYGNGDGTFAKPVSYPGAGISGTHDSRLISADVNDDGKPDIVFSEPANNAIGVITNFGKRRFSPPVQYKVGAHPYGLCAGDFNGDGQVDIAVADDNDATMAVLYNNARGGFKPAIFYKSTPFPADVVCADFRHTGHLDLAISNDDAGNVYFFPGDGKGHFGPATVIDLFGGPSGAPTRLAVGDFNNDGNLDMASGATFGDTAAVLFGRGDGAFGLSPAFPANPRPDVLTGIDLVGDGNLDLLIPNRDYGEFTVLRNLGQGIMAAPITFMTGGGSAHSVASADLDSDGRPDAVVTDRGNGTVCVFLNRTITEPKYLFQNRTTGAVLGSISCNASLPTPVPIGTTLNADWKVAGYADLNNDQQPDILAQNQKTGAIQCLFLNGTVVTGQKILQPSLALNIKLVGTPDLNQDGHPDMLLEDMQTGILSYWLMDGTKRIGGGRISMTVPTNKQVVGTADLTGDGNADIVLQDQTTSEVIVWQMRSSEVAKIVSLGLVPGVSWKVVGFTTVEGHGGLKNIVFEDQQTGALKYWTLDRLKRVSNQPFTSHVPPGLALLGLR